MGKFESDASAVSHSESEHMVTSDGHSEDGGDMSAADSEKRASLMQQARQEMH